MIDYEEDLTDFQSFKKKLYWPKPLVDAYRADDTDQRTVSSGSRVTIPPPCDGPTSWFKYGVRIDDWQDLTVLEAGKRGPALKNRLMGDAAMYT